MSARAWVCCVVAIVFGIGAIATECVQAWTSVALREDGIPTQASIVQIANYKGIKCGVTYQDASGARHGAVLSNQCRGMQVGQTIPVKYLRTDPSTVAAVGTLSVVYIAVSKSGVVFVGLVLFGFGVLGILAGTGVLGRWIERRRQGRIGDARPHETTGA